MTPFAAAQLIFAPRSAGDGQAVRAEGGVRGRAGAGHASAWPGSPSSAPTTPIWVLIVLTFVQGAGMANVMPPATESIMSSLPREKAGVGSAVSNTVRQVGGALGVAVLGSVLAAVYRERDRRRRRRRCRRRPAAAASESISGAYGVAERAGPAGAGADRGGQRRVRHRDALGRRPARRSWRCSASAWCSRWLPRRSAPHGPRRPRPRPSTGRPELAGAGLSSRHDRPAMAAMTATDDRRAGDRAGRTARASRPAAQRPRGRGDHRGRASTCSPRARRSRRSRSRRWPPGPASARPPSTGAGPTRRPCSSTRSRALKGPLPEIGGESVRDDLVHAAAAGRPEQRDDPVLERAALPHPGAAPQPRRCTRSTSGSSSPAASSCAACCAAASPPASCGPTSTSRSVMAMLVGPMLAQSIVNWNPDLDRDDPARAAGRRHLAGHRRPPLMHLPSRRACPRRRRVGRAG